MCQKNKRWLTSGQPIEWATARSAAREISSCCHGIQVLIDHHILEGFNDPFVEQMRSFFFTCASKPLAGTGHSKTMRAKARRDLSCTKRGETVSLRPWSQERRPAVCCRAPSPGTSGLAGTWGPMSGSKASPSTAGEPPGLHVNSQKVCPRRPERLARLRGANRLCGHH